MSMLRYVLPGLLCLGLPVFGIEAQGPPQANYARLPLSFDKEPGGSGDRFVARGQGYVVGLESGKVLIGEKNHAVSLEFAGARSGVRAVPGAELPGKVNYIRGNDPRKWQIGLRTYARVEYPEMYPGIDVVYYGNQQQLEFDLVVQPGADPEAIRLKIAGAGRLSIDGSGALNLGEAAGNLRVALPRIYQETNGTEKGVAGHYAIIGPDLVAFRIDLWDHTRPLVIDPVVALPALTYSTLLGGTTGSTSGQGIALDSSKNMYVAGYTSSEDFPVVNAYQGAINGTQQDGFVTEINAAGTAFVYSTYIGGSASDQFQAIAVDSTGAAWVAGSTSSTDFPLVNSIQATAGGGGDAVIVKLGPSGAPVFSTYLGGSANDVATGVAVDALKNAYVTGYTNGPFPTTSGVFQSSNNGSSNAFVAKFSSTASELYATLLGGTGSEKGYAVAADALGDAYVTGSSTSAAIPNAPLLGAQTTNAGAGDAFVAKVNPLGTGLLYFTFLGGAAADQGNAIAVDLLGDAFIGGSTASTGLATAGVAQPALGGGTDGFVAELNPLGTQFSFFTYLGGNRQDQINGLTIDGLGNVFVAGQTESINFPVPSAVQPSVPGTGVTLFQTTNSGSAWTGLDANIPGAVFDVTADPVTSGTIVVTTEQGIYRTTNGGGSWTQQLSGLFTAGSLSRSPAAAGTIYAVESTGGFPTAYLSTDGGITWATKGTVPVTLFAPNFVQGSGIVADPLTAGTAYAFSFTGSFISGAVQKTTDSGQTWSAAVTGLPSQTLLSAMVAGADGSLYVATSSSGVYKSTNQGGAWAAVNTGLPVGLTLFQHSITVSATNPSILYLATGSQIYTTANGGASWSAVSPIPGYKGTAGALVIAVSPLNSSIVYTWSAYAYMSADGGITWNYASLPGITVNAFAFDPLSATHVFAVADVTNEAFAANLNSAGTGLTWSTYLGSSSGSQAFGVATDGAGNAFVTGSAGNGAGGFPTTSGALEASLTNGSAFVAEISDTATSCTYTVSPAAQTITGTNQFAWFTLLTPSGCTWNLSSDSSWASFPYGVSGTGTVVVSVQAATNSSGTSRTANLTIGGQTVTLTQASSSCMYSISPTSFSVPAAGGAVSVNLTTGAGCPWTVSDYSADIAITSGASGTGSGVIALTVSANTGTAARQLSLAVGSTSIVIVQASSVQLFQSINFGPLNNQALGSIPPALNGTATSGLTVTFTSTTPTICTVSGTAVTLLTTGTCTIIASQAGNAGFIAATPVTQSFTVTIGAAQSIGFDAIPNQILGVSPFPLAAQSSAVLPVSFTVTTPAVCKISDNLVMLLSAGTCSIAAGQPGNGAFNAATPVTNSFTVVTAKTSTTFTAAGPSIQVGSSPQSMAVGDFNGDGVPDLAVANFNDGTMTVLLGTGTGAFNAASKNPVTLGSNPRGVAVGDFTGNGKQDLIAANSADDNVSVLLGNGSGGFTAEQNNPFVVDPSSLVVGDFNGDGIQDFASTDLTSNTLKILLGNGSGGFTGSHNGIPFPVGSSPQAVAVGDFNGDGIEDLVTANFSGSSVTVLQGDGAGNFAPFTGSPVSVGSHPYSVAVGDFNGDGIQDLATANLLGNNVTVLLGNGSGGFSPAPGNPFPVGSNPASVVVGDFNGDGFADLAVANSGTNTVTVLLGNGKGGFAPAPASPFTVGNSPQWLVVADFNGDGIEDIAAANTNDGTVIVLLGSLGTPQTITFNSLNTVSYGVAPFTLSATATSGLAVTFASTTSGICTVSGNTVTIVGVGMCTITANQVGSLVYQAAATVPQSFTVNLGSQTITFGTLSNQTPNSTPPPLSATVNSGLTITYVSNSMTVCTVSGVTVKLLTIGTCSITASQTGNSDWAGATPVTRTFLVSVGPLAVVSLSPSSGAGASVTFKAVYSDPNGTADLNTVLLQMNSTQSSSNACYVFYQPQGNHLYLANNAGAWITPALTPGVAGTAANSQCTLNAGSSSVATAGTNLTLTVALTFNSSFTISRNVYLYAAGGNSQNSGWVNAGTWTPSPIASPPAIVGLAPNSGAGASVTYRAVYTDPNGVGDLNTVLLQINTGQGGINACYIYYQPQGNHLYLANNAGTWITPALTPGVAGTASSSQCTLNAGSSSVSMAGNNLTLNAALSFNSGFTGYRGVYLYAAGFSGLNSGWVKQGTWTPNPVAQPPTIVSLTPNTGAGSSVKLQAVYSDPNGAGDLNTLLLQINSTQNSSNACYVFFQPQGNLLYLANNTGAWITPALTPGVAGTASNSQCTLNAGTSTIATSGNTMTLTLALSFNSSFTISRNIYMYAAGFSGLNSGWVDAGSWTPNPIAKPPTIVSLSPASGTGTSVTLQAVYTDPNGAGDLNTVLLQINSTQTGTNACYVYYQPQGNHLYLANNAGAWITPALTPGVAGTASNNQCTLNAASSKVVLSGNNLTLTVALSFTGTFVGTKNVYLYATGYSGLSSGWVKEGTWTP
jgi:FG-GAP-like repeat/Beta-propeller repeat